eukprot:704016-Amphidinium_carterae.3
MCCMAGSSAVLLIDTDYDLYRASFATNCWECWPCGLIWNVLYVCRLVSSCSPRMRHRALACVVRTRLSLEEAVLGWSLRSNNIAKGKGRKAVMCDAGLYQLSREESRNILTVASNPEMQRSRVVLAIDSQVVVWVAVSALWYLGNFGFSLNQLVSTENNPADDPTQRVEPRKACLPSPGLQNALIGVDQKWPWAADMTRLLWAEQKKFNSCLGFPGEGHEIRNHVDLRLSVQPATIRRYKQRVERVETWLKLEDLPPLASLSHDLEALSVVLAAFVQYLHDQDKPYTHAVEALAGIQFFYPQSQHCLTIAWRAVRTWGQSISRFRSAVQCHIVWCLHLPLRP